MTAVKAPRLTDYQHILNGYTRRQVEDLAILAFPSSLLILMVALPYTSAY
jgi:hypothetical protein